MVSITIDQFVEKYIKNNPKENKTALTRSLQAAVAAKQSGACCDQCHQPIWAIGTAIAGWSTCFTCLTGEADHSEDYEIDLVY